MSLLIRQLHGAPDKTPATANVAHGKQWQDLDAGLARAEKHLGIPRTSWRVKFLLPYKLRPKPEDTGDAEGPFTEDEVRSHIL